MPQCCAFGKTEYNTVMPYSCLSPSEVAQLLGVSRSSVLRLIRSGALASIRVGPRTIRVSVAELERFVETRTIPSPETRGGSAQ